MKHIDEKGNLMEQWQINSELTGELKPSEQPPLFTNELSEQPPLLHDEEPSWISNKKISRSRKNYTPKGEQYR